MKVIYVMGAGRSGSTVLDTVLGSHPLIQSVGELKIATRAILNQEYCSCGRQGQVCPFWAQVMPAWCRCQNIHDIEEYDVRKDAVELLKQWVLPGKSPVNSAYERYAQETYALFQTLQKVSGKNVIVDSSKDRGRAYALSMIPGIDLYIIHLVRDARGVAWSLKKSFEKNEKAGLPNSIRGIPAWRAAGQWCLVNIESEWVRRRVPPSKSMFMRYEDFTADPKTALMDIGQLIGCDFTDFANRVASGEALPVHHSIAGNRLRMAGSIKLRSDDEWKQKLSDEEKLSINFMSGWMMRRYGYR